MKTAAIITAIQDAAKYAAALDVIAPIAISPGHPADIAAVIQAANRLADQLESIKKQIARELHALKMTQPATARRDDEDVINMLIRTQEAAQ